jgi:sugar lactone lactonase YvrE
MDKILCIVLVLFAISASAQIDRKNKRVGNFKDCIFLPDSGDWYNIQNPPQNLINSKKLTLLHFWDPSNIESQGIIQDLNSWAKNHYEFEVYTILSTDYKALKDRHSVMDLILRHEIRHPLFAPYELGDVPGINFTSAPVLAVINQKGELHKKLIGNVEIQSAWAELDSLGSHQLQHGGLDRIIRSAKYIPDRAPKSVLGNLSHICASPRSARVYVSDHKKHRILIVDVDGQMNEKIGVGKAGWVDGRSATARFNGPSGMAVDEVNQILYVADTYNHLIRQVDLKYGVVSTILGTGEQGLIPPKEVVGLSGRLSFPMDLELRGGKLYIAMSGYNQIWEMDLTSTKAKPIAGDGKLGSIDGGKKVNRLSAPRDLTFDQDGSLYFVEPTLGKIRELTPNGKVKTLYEPVGDTLIGDLQFPSSIISYNDELFFSDSYNNRICRMSRKVVDVVAGGSGRGFSDGKGAKAQFASPGSMAYLAGDFFLIDLGNQVIRKVDARNFKVETLEITSITGANNYEQAISEGEEIYTQTVLTGDGTNVITFNLDMGDDYELVSWGRNEAAMDDGGDVNSLVNYNIGRGTIEFTALGDYDNYDIQFELYITYTHVDKPGVIYYQSAMVLIPLEYQPGGNTVHEVSYYLAKDFID